MRIEGRGQRSEDRGQRSEGRNSRQPIAVSQKDREQRTDFSLGSANLKEGSFEKYFRNISLMVTRAVGCYSNDI